MRKEGEDEEDQPARRGRTDGRRADIFDHREKGAGFPMRHNGKKDVNTYVQLKVRW